MRPSYFQDTKGYGAECLTSLASNREMACSEHQCGGLQLLENIPNRCSYGSAYTEQEPATRKSLDKNYPTQLGYI